jgi:hypothetical protein
MKLNKIAFGVALATGAMTMGATSAIAADTLLFPYVVNSTTTTTIVSVIDRGDGATNRYSPAGVVGSGAGFNRNHWRLHFKDGANATSNTATCGEINFFLPSSPNDLQSVDLGGTFGATTRGVLFNDPSSNNNWNVAGVNFNFASTLNNPMRGALFVHNADSVVGQTMQGEAMVLEYANGAAWGYQALAVDNGGANTAAGFDFSALGSTTGQGITFMPPAETFTRLFVTPLNDAGSSMLAANGASLGNWGGFSARVRLNDAPGGGGAGVAFDRDENLVSGSLPQVVNCVGAVDLTAMIQPAHTAAGGVLANGGWSNLIIEANPTTGAGLQTTTTANVVKLDFSIGGQFNGQGVGAPFNNAYRLN